MPLDLRDAHARAALTITTTVVPGTVWTELGPDRSTTLLHRWDLDDASGFIARYKRRYERPLPARAPVVPALTPTPPPAPAAAPPAAEDAATDDAVDDPWRDFWQEVSR